MRYTRLNKFNIFMIIATSIFMAVSMYSALMAVRPQIQYNYDHKKRDKTPKIIRRIFEFMNQHGNQFGR